MHNTSKNKTTSSSQSVGYSVIQSISQSVNVGLYCSSISPKK